MTLTESILEIMALTLAPVTFDLNAGGHIVKSGPHRAAGATPLDACKRLLAQINEASVADIERRAAKCAADYPVTGVAGGAR